MFNALIIEQADEALIDNEAGLCLFWSSITSHLEFPVHEDRRDVTVEQSLMRRSTELLPACSCGLGMVSIIIVISV